MLLPRTDPIGRQSQQDKGVPCSNPAVQRGAGLRVAQIPVAGAQAGEQVCYVGFLH